MALLTLYRPRLYPSAVTFGGSRVLYQGSIVYYAS